MSGINPRGVRGPAWGSGSGHVKAGLHMKGLALISCFRGLKCAFRPSNCHSNGDSIGFRGMEHGSKKMIFKF
jgi:hypothetical protein